MVDPTIPRSVPTDDARIGGDGAAPEGASAPLPAPADAPPEEPADAPGHLDQIRDILFGQKQAQVEARFEQLEARVARDLGALREEVGRRIEGLEAFARAETEGLARRLDAERRERGQAVHALAESMRTRGAEIETQLASFREEADASDRVLRQQVLDEAARAQDALRSRADALVREIEDTAARLGDEKADRHALATLFADAAARLSDGR